ncbi:MAG: hypothetical protein QM651_09360 [Rhodoblastus sp.]
MSFTRALRGQGLALGAQMAREIHVATGYGGHKLLIGILEPIVGVGVAIYWHTLLKADPPYGTSRVLYISSGLFCTYVFIHVSSEFRSLAKGAGADRRFPAVNTIDFVLAAAAMKSIFYGFVGFLGFAYIYYEYTSQAAPTNWHDIIAGFAALVMFGLGIGLCNASLERLWPVWRYIWAPIARAQILFSGVLYCPSLLRSDIRDILSWNPVLHASEIFRMGFYPMYPKVIYDGRYLWTCIFIVLLLGLALDRGLRRRLARG